MNPGSLLRSNLGHEVFPRWEKEPNAVENEGCSVVPN